VGLDRAIDLPVAERMPRKLGWTVEDMRVVVALQDASVAEVVKPSDSEECAEGGAAK
jgi:hypothetical protein